MLCQVFLPEYQIVPGFNKALSESRTAMSGQVFAGNKWGVSSSGLTGTGAQLCATMQPAGSHMEPLELSISNKEIHWKMDDTGLAMDQEISRKCKNPTIGYTLVRQRTSQGKSGKSVAN